MSEPKPLPLVVKDLSFRYHTRDSCAIRNINLSLEPGQIMLLAGSSGCGKTTLMRCINGLIPHSYNGEMTGEILVHGQSIEGMKLSQISRHIGTLLQDPERQILGTYVLNEVCFGLESMALPRKEMLPIAHKALERLRILYLKDKETFFTSGGEKQKVALAGVLAMEPDILLLDEPLASLDPASAHEALLAFRELADEGLSIMIVEHRVDDVLAIKPEKVLYMEDGEINYYGDVAGLMETVDYSRIKLPAEVIARRAKGKVHPVFKPTVPELDKDSEPLLSFQDVRFQYKEDTPEVLHGINLDVRSGEVIAILGHNGSGKTTMVKHALGLLKPTSGKVLLEGVDSKKIDHRYFGQNDRLCLPKPPSQMLFASTVREELAYGPENLGFSKEQVAENVDWAIDTVNLEEELSTPPPLALSFGQQKRVSIASVLSMRSRILMMDEPTAGQDYWNYKSFMDTILQTPGFDSIIFITHDLDLALIYANRVIVLYGGEIVADGHPQDILLDEEKNQKVALIANFSAKIESGIMAKDWPIYAR